MKIFVSIHMMMCIKLLFASFLPKLAYGNVCYMMYTMADSRNDIEEYIQSNAIQDPNVTSWVYLDSRNFDNVGEDISASLPNVFNTNGSEVSAPKFDGSYYLTYDHYQQKMIIANSSKREQNSDNPSVVQEFLHYALEDCVRKGSTEYFAMFSSNGGGFTRHGGNQHSRRLLHSTSLQQSHRDLNTAIGRALSSVEGAPSKLNVLAFDACSMSDVGALIEYRNVTNYIMASEATIPGHGFVFSTMNNTNSALELAQDMFYGYLNETQSEYDQHQTPKTLAIIDTAAFTKFLQQWDRLFHEIRTLIAGSYDSKLHTILSRTRSTTLSYMSSVDESPQSPSLVDVGQFLSNFISLCAVDPNSQLATILSSAQVAYQNMYIVQGYGPGTASATGMGIMWPSQIAYTKNEDNFDQILNSSSIYGTGAVPNWHSFLQAFYTSLTPQAGNSTTSVCRSSLSPSVEQSYDGQMIFGASASSIDTSKISTAGLLFSAETSIETDYIVVSYGLHITKTHHHSRHLQREIRHASRQLSKTTSDNSVRYVRQLQDEDTASSDFIFQYGGNMRIEYNGTHVQAKWDRSYYWMMVNDISVMLSVTDMGNGQKSFPVCYFPSDLPFEISSSQLKFWVDTAHAIEYFGCIRGEVIFSTYDNGSYSSSLYGYDSKYQTYKEIPKSAGGRVAPIMYVDASIKGRYFTNIVGGVDGIIFDWDTKTSFEILRLDDVTIMKALDKLKITSKGIVVAKSYDFDILDWDTGAGFDTFIYEYGTTNIYNGTTTTGDDVMTNRLFSTEKHNIAANQNIYTAYTSGYIEGYILGKIFCAVVLFQCVRYLFRRC